jgi:ADP-heptose:LPS heptosyltransferase
MQKKILVIRFSSIGDIVLCTPIPRALKQQYPKAEIHFLTKPGYQSLLENNPNIDQIHLLDKHPILKALELKQLGFDMLIDLHVNTRTLLFKSILAVPSHSFSKINIEKWIAVNLKLPALPAIHIVDRNFKAIEHLGVYNDLKGLDFYLQDTEIEAIKSKLPGTHQQFIGWAIGAQHATKKLPIEQITYLIQQTSFPIVLLGGKEDTEIATQIANQFPNRVIHYCGKYNIRESAALVALSKFVISNDTGLMHIAAALKKPILSFWGNTIPALGMSPYYGNNEVNHVMMEVKDLPCRPCSKIGFDTCPKQHFNCMKQLNFGMILTNMNQLWQA